MTETIYYKSHPSWLSFLGLLLLSGLFLILSFSGELSAGGLILSIIFLCIAAFARHRKEYLITDERVLMRVGLIANHTNEMDITHILGLNVRQNAWERIIGIGCLVIISAADGGAEVVFQGIRNPVGIKDMIRSLRGVP